MARDRESECTMESSNDSSARINICPFRVSTQLWIKKQKILRHFYVQAIQIWMHKGGLGL